MPFGNRAPVTSHRESCRATFNDPVISQRTEQLAGRKSPRGVNKRRETCEVSRDLAVRPVSPSSGGWTRRQAGASCSFSHSVEASPQISVPSFLSRRQPTCELKQMDIYYLKQHFNFNKRMWGICIINVRKNSIAKRNFWYLLYG